MTNSNATASAAISTDEHGRILNDPTHAKPLGHGNSSAAWALVLIVLLGAVVVMVGSLGAFDIVLYVGIGLMVIGPIVGFVMRQMGYGVGGSKSSAQY